MNTTLATCLICLKNNYKDENLVLIDLFTTEWENSSHLNKLQNVLSAEVTVFEETLVCTNCLDDLNKAFEFRERVIRALDYWSSKFDDSVTFQSKNVEENYEYRSDEHNFEIKSDEQEFENKSDVPDMVDIKDDNEICEINTSAEDVVSTTVSDLDHKIESPDGDTDTVRDVDPISNLVYVTSSESVDQDCEKQTTDVSEEKKEKKQKQGTYKCIICDLRFMRLWKLNKHMEIHGVDRKFVCKFCNHAFKQSYHLREHMTTHTGERNFSCEVCGKKFQRLSSLKRHSRSHQAPPGEKSKKTPFLCNICGKRFPYSNGAQRHMRIHTGDKRYNCNVCGKKFNQSTHLKVHLRTHTGERPYMCTICGDTFSLKASLHKHVISAHGESKNDVKIFQNLEPNLTQTHDDDDSDEKKDFDIDGIPLYHEGFLIT